MTQSVVKILFSSRSWLTASALCFCVALLISYHEDQMSAHKVLSQKVGEPHEVLIQEFDLDADMNLINEVRVLGEMDPEMHTLVNIGSESSPSWVVVCPIFPVGPETLPLANQYFRTLKGEARRPMPREKAADIAAASSNLSATTALAYTIHSVRSLEDFSVLEARRDFDLVAETETRQLIAVTGAVVSGHDLRGGVENAMATSGVKTESGSIFIDPESLSRELAGDVPVGGLRHWFVTASVLLGLGAILIPQFAARRSSKPTAKPCDTSVRATSKLPAVNIFQPIATQDELTQIEEKALAERKNSQTVWAYLNKLGVTVFQGGFRIRSPR